MDVMTREMLFRIKEALQNGVSTHMSRSGIDFKVIKCEVVNLDQDELAFHAASKIYRAKLTLELNGKASIHNALVKTMPHNPRMREVMESIMQFHNEHVIYHDVIPELLKKVASHTEKKHLDWWAPQELFLRCYYSRSGDHEQAMIALEDLTGKGYRIRGHPVTLAMEYSDVSIAIRALARFHALSYDLKLREPEYFQKNLANILKNTRPVVTDPEKEDWTHYLDYLHLSTLLSCDRLEKEDKEGKYKDGIRKLREVMNDPTVLHRLLTPEEPLAVICHGDFVMNNMLFKDDEVKLLDFQHAMYSSPSIDLATIFFMHSGEFINRWDELLQEYHSCLFRCLGRQPKELSLDAFHEDFRKCGLFGFMVSVAFLISVGDNPGRTTFEDELKDTPKDPKERRIHLKKNMFLESEETTRRVLAVVREAIDRGLV